MDAANLGTTRSDVEPIDVDPSPDLTSPDLTSPDLTSPDLASPALPSPDPRCPRSAEIPLEFLIGRDVRGHWLAVETHGLAGGFFASASDALRFVHSDCHPRAARIEIVEDVLEPFGASCHEIAARCRKRHPG